MAPYAFKRTERLNDLLRESIGALLLSEIKEPRVQGVTVTRVESADDMQSARIFYRSIFTTAEQKQEIEAIQIGLEKIQGFIRHALGKSLRLKKIPQLKFIYDAGLERHSRIEELLHQVAQESRENE